MERKTRVQNIWYIAQNINTNQLTEQDKIEIGSYIIKEIGHDKVIEKSHGVVLFFDSLSDDHLNVIVEMMQSLIVKNRNKINLVLQG